MPSAFVMLNVESGKESVVIHQLKATKNVEDVYYVFGVFDIVAKVEAGSNEELKETITWRIRKLERVKSTQTLMVIE